jgi:hypothetical protein
VTPLGRSIILDKENLLVDLSSFLIEDNEGVYQINDVSGLWRWSKAT